MNLYDPLAIASDPTQDANTDAPTQPARKPVAAPTTGPTALPIAPSTPTNQSPTTQPAAPTAPATAPTTAPAPSPSTPTAAQPIAPPPLSTTDPMAFAAPTSAETAGAQWTDPYGVRQGVTPTGSVAGLPTGWTTGSQNMGDAGDAYYNGQSVNQVRQNPDGTYTISLNAANGLLGGGATNSTQDTVNVSGADWQQIMNALNTNLASQPYQQYQTDEYKQLLSDPVKYAAELGGSGIPGTAENFQNQQGPDTYLQNGVLQDANGNPVNPDGSPVSGAKAPPTSSSATTLYNPMTIAGTAAPSTGAAPSPVPATLAPTSANPSGGTGTTASGSTGATPSGYTLAPTDPNNPLTAQTIMPGPGLDFLAQAKQNLADWEAQTQPQYDATLRDANRYNFAAGRGQSGIATNSIGDLELQRENAIRSAQDQFLTNAMGQQNANNYANIGILQQQQGFQNQQQQEAFSNALQQLTAGSQGDPSQIALILAQIFGSQAGGIGNAASQYAQSQQQNAQMTQQQQQFQQWLESMMQGTY